MGTLKCLTMPIKTIVLICRKPSWSSACKQSTLSHSLFIRYCKKIANLLGNLAMPGHTHSLMFICWQELHPSHFPCDIGKILQTCYFRYFGHAWLCAPMVILSTCRKLLCLSAGKKTTSLLMLFHVFPQRYVNFLFWIIWASLAMHIQNDSINL